MIKRILLFVINAYQKIKKRLLKIGLLKNSCRFKPTCSNYCAQAIKQYGIIKGVPRCFFRIVRCNPWNKGGRDPVS